MSLRCQTEQADAGILGIFGALNQFLFEQALNNFGYPAFDNTHFQRDALGGQVSFFPEKHQAPQFSVREVKTLALILHALLATLKQFRYKILKLL
jgi:hypothetical protein